MQERERERERERDFLCSLVCSSSQSTPPRVLSLQSELKATCEEFDHTRAELELRSNNATDTEPLNKLKSSLTQMRTEIRAFDLRIGVLAHEVMHTKYAKLKKEKEAAQQQTRGAVGA